MRCGPLSSPCASVCGPASLSSRSRGGLLTPGPASSRHSRQKPRDRPALSSSYLSTPSSTPRPSTLPPESLARPPALALPWPSPTSCLSLPPFAGGPPEAPFSAPQSENHCSGTDSIASLPFRLCTSLCSHRGPVSHGREAVASAKSHLHLIPHPVLPAGSGLPCRTGPGAAPGLCGICCLLLEAFLQFQQAPPLEATSSLPDLTGHPSQSLAAICMPPHDCPPPCLEGVPSSQPQRQALHRGSVLCETGRVCFRPGSWCLLQIWKPAPALWCGHPARHQSSPQMQTQTPLPFPSGKIRWRRDRRPTPVSLGLPCGSAGNRPAMQETWV